MKFTNSCYRCLRFGVNIRDLGSYLCVRKCVTLCDVTTRSQMQNTKSLALHNNFRDSTRIYITDRADEIIWKRGLQN